jgi:hypothetical protein
MTKIKFFVLAAIILVSSSTNAYPGDISGGKACDVTVNRSGDISGGKTNVNTTGDISGGKYFVDVLLALLYASV